METILITAEEEGRALDGEREAILRDLAAIREMVAALRQKVEAGETGTAVEAGKILSDLRTWLKFAKETEVQIDRHRKEHVRVCGSYGLDLDAARHVVGSRLDRVRRCCRERGVPDGT